MTLPELATVEPDQPLGGAVGENFNRSGRGVGDGLVVKALPVPLTLKVALFVSVPSLSTVLPVRSISPLSVTVPPVIVVPLTRQPPEASTVTLPELATVEP